MGQAQRSGRYSPARRAEQDRGRTTAGNGGKRRAAAKEVPRREVELWEINREEDQPRLMRLAEREAEIPGRKTPAERAAKVSGRKKPAEREAEIPRRKKTAGQAAEAPRQRKPAGHRYDGPQPIRFDNPGRPRSAQAARRRRAKRRRALMYRVCAIFVITIGLILIYQTAGAIYRIAHGEKIEKNKGIVDVVSEKLEEEKIVPPEITEDFLEINDFSRPGTKLKKVKSVFVHYTANPGTSAQQNRSYFANLAETQERSASAHFIIGYEGELVQCIPLEEQAYAVATRNEDSLSIECCYLDEDGRFTQETYDTLIHTLAWLLQEYHLSTDDILRHYDCGGKLCPLYYVEHEDAWEKLLSDVESYKDE